MLNLASGMSLLLCAAVVVLGARSYRACDTLVHPSAPGDRVCVTSEFGVLVFEIEAPLRDPVSPGWEYFDTPMPRRWPVRSAGLGFEAYRAQVTHFVRLPPTAVWGVAVPHWAVGLAFGALPAWRLLRLRRDLVRRRRAAAGFCVRCGYDLRATPQTCPECGTAALPA